MSAFLTKYGLKMVTPKMKRIHFMRHKHGPGHNSSKRQWEMEGGPKPTNVNHDKAAYGSFSGESSTEMPLKL